ncbi:uncharacterized protein LOC122361612 [Puntigrus tetrazona]|uniref:uncharacterized protein LOC122361612 n=1 Tax=Puntigrus tetrazona TaxID=1606681 RepID=UPI001C8ADF2D|nr:uncharacterized protein LOC122361612 [Puntigrus tetrazona]
MLVWGQECFCKGYGSGAFSATDTLTFGKPITLKVLPKDVSPVAPFLSILSPLTGTGQDICLAAGFFPVEKTMILTEKGAESESLSVSGAPIFATTKNYYFAGFNGKKIQQCQMDKEEADKTETLEPHVVTDKPEIQTAQSCETNNDTSEEFINAGDPKMNSINLLVTGLRILLAKCVAVNVMMTVKAFIF